MICAFIKSKNQSLNYFMIIEHFGDSIFPYINNDVMMIMKTEKVNLPITIRSKIKYVDTRTKVNTRFHDHQSMFPDSKIGGLKREIR